MTFEDSEEDVPVAVPLSSDGAQHEESRDVETQVRTSTPVLLVTGFLGAGKTTLLNYILTEKHGYKCAVILNEFGDSAGIERAILNDSQGNAAFELQDWVELSNGCACCSVKNDFIKALEGLMARNGLYDYVLIETTGLASPGPIASALWTDAELESAVCLDSIVTVVDAANISRQLTADREKGSICEAQEQIAYADIILCNKIDRLSTDEERDVILSKLRAINEDAAIHWGGLMMGQWVGGAASQWRGKSVSQPRTLIGTILGLQQSGWLHQALLICRGIKRFRLQSWLDIILWEKEAGADILRLKGVVNTPHARERKVIQAVHEVYDIHDARPWEGAQPEANQIVLIGRGLDEERLRQSFMHCIL